MEDFLQALESWCRAYGYPVLFGGVMLENAGIPVPGETVVLVAGFLASERGGGLFDVRVVIAVTVAAAVLGDNIGYWLGRRLARPRLERGKGLLFLTPPRLRATERYFERFGSWTIFVARFISGLRVVGALAAGAAGMHWPRFLLANALGAVTWGTIIALAGYFFGRYLPTVEYVLSRTGLALLGLVLAAGLAVYFWQRRRRRASSVPPDAGRGPGVDHRGG